MEGLSTQVYRLTRLAATHMSWFVADMFIDVALVKTRTSRSEFNRMISECEKDKIDTESVKAELLISMIEGCDQDENDWRSENIRLGLKYRLEDGISRLYNKVCYSYKEAEHGMLIIDEKAVEVVIDIFDRYLESYSIGGIINKLKEKILSHQRVEIRRVKTE